MYQLLQYSGLSRPNWLRDYHPRNISFSVPDVAYAFARTGHGDGVLMKPQTLERPRFCVLILRTVRKPGCAIVCHDACEGKARG